MKAFKAVEDEINQIRIKIFEETKNLTPEQYTERVRKIGEKAAEKYGFLRIPNARLEPANSEPNSATI